MVQVHVEERVVHGRSATLATIRFAATAVVVPMTAVPVVADTTAVVRVRAVILATPVEVDSRSHAVAVQVRVAQAVRRRDDDGRFGRLWMLALMPVVMVMMVITAAAFGRKLIVRAVRAAVIRSVIRGRDVLFVVDATLGRVRRFQGRAATAQALRHVIVGHQSTTDASAVIIVCRGRCVRRIGHHVATTADDACPAAATARVVHSHVSRLRTVGRIIIIFGIVEILYRFFGSSKNEICFKQGHCSIH